MGHDYNLLLGLKKLLERKSLNPRLNSRGLLRSLTLTAKVGDPVGGLDNRLIATSAQSKLHGGTRCLKVFYKALVISTKTYTECKRKIISDIYSLDLIEQGKFVLLELIQILLRHHEHVLVLLKALDYGVDICHVFVDLSVDQGNKKRVSYFLKRLKYLIVVINIYETRNQLLIVVLLSELIYHCHIKHVERKEGVRLAVVS